MKTCNGPLCKGINIPISDFGSKQTQCKKCKCYNIKKYYKVHGRAYRNFKNEVKSNSKCTECGCDDVRLLEFDHLDKKNITISKSFSKTAIQNELQHTQILCIWCHRLKTRKQFDIFIKENIVTSESIERPQNEEGKVCNGPLCEGKLQFKNKFYRLNSGNQCILCLADIGKQKRQQNSNHVKELKMGLGECELCKLKVTEETTCCFDFDHLRDKNTNISILAKLNGDKRKEIDEEVKKCRLLCCKCHKLVTIEQLGFNYIIPPTE